MSQAHQSQSKKKGASKSKKTAASLAAQAELTEFITIGDLHSVSNILQPGFKFDLNVPGPDGNTPLGLACQLGHSKIITALVIAKADINQVDSEGVSPLGHVCKSGHQDAVEALLALKADPNFHAASTSSPISMAATGNHLEVVIRLVDAKADVNPSGDKPLYLACKGNYLPLVEYLLAKGATIPDEGSKKHFSRQVKALFSVAARITEELEAPTNMTHSSSGKNTHSSSEKQTQFHPPKTASERLEEYIEDGNTAQVKSILQKVDINARWPRGDTPLELACAKGHIEIINALVKAKAEVNTTNHKKETPLFFALYAKKNAPEAVAYLLSQKADANHKRADGWSPFCIAAFLGNVPIIQALLQYKADIEKTISSGSSPVWLAAQEDRAEAIQTLAAAKADLNKTNHEGVSPLWKAAKSGHKKAVDALLAQKADPNGHASLAAPPICMATSGGHIDVVKSLVVAKADVNGPPGSNPLYLAYKLNNHPLVQYLKENGADVEMFDRIIYSTSFTPAVNEFPGEEAFVKISMEDTTSEKDASIKGGPTSQQGIPHSSSRSILLAQPHSVPLALESLVLAAGLSEESASPVAEEDSTPTKIGCVPA
jgi:ankyrin repeat protein